MSVCIHVLFKLEAIENGLVISVRGDMTQEKQQPVCAVQTKHTRISLSEETCVSLVNYIAKF